MSWASFAGSLIAVLAVVGLVRWLGLGRAEPIDAETARRIAAETFPGHRFGPVAVDRDGRAALLEGSAGEFALVRAHGDKWVARLLGGPVAARAEGERLIVAAGEAMFGATTLTLGTDEARRWADRLGRA